MSEGFKTVTQCCVPQYT